MRLHHLDVTAFGPFGGTVRVDFDALSESGLFLLTGATGAGKSSVLDAVCFALYGEVPGDRHDAKHLRSDHAPGDAAPEVRLELSVGERRFLFTRSPAWERPKRRGTGTTRQQARVIVEEQRGASWTTLTTRLDDAGLFVTGLLGMTCTQFTQVAMLPQGHFQAFLRATSAERHAVLQRLFRTDRFERIERWLSDHRRELRRHERDRHDRVMALAHRFSEAAGEPLPVTWADADPAHHDPDDLTAWTSAALDAARTGLVTAEESAARALEAHRVATDEHRRALALQELQSRGRRARQLLAELDEDAADHASREAAVAAHRRAAGIADRIDRVVAARDEVDRLAGEVRSALDFVEAPAADADAVAAALDAAIRSEQQAEADLRLETEHADAVRRVAELTATLAVEAAAIDAGDARLADLDAAITAQVTAIEEHELLAAELGSLRISHQAATEGRRAAVDLLDAATELARLEGEFRECVDQVLLLREAHLDAREARIHAMAGELAGQLASGCACPVCGSIEHPSPAGGTVEAGRQQEEATLRAWETAETTRLATEQALFGARSRHDKTMDGAQGRTAAQWSEDLTGLDQALEQARTAAERLPTAKKRLDGLRSERETLAGQLSARRAGHAHLTTGLAEAEAEALVAAAACEKARGEFPDLARRAAHHRARTANLSHARAAVTALTLARSVLEEADATAARALDEAGFESADAARAVLLDADQVAIMDAAVARHDEARRDAEAVLGSGEVVEALAQEAADVEVTATALNLADVVRGDADAVLTTMTTAAGRLAELDGETRAAIAAWQPVRADFAVAESVSTLAEGTSRDNLLKMRLSAYVLGERLRQVVAAANDRLAGMTDQRYALEHTEERGVGAQKGGLSLRVRDDWTGVRRDPATLSGGETFVVSLALALGLADTVAHEAGGVPIDMLFIDEGFGSLDAETLDGVMDTLDSLRNNGRVIGVVSHVPELRERIPVGIEVQKARKGSTLTRR